MVKEPRNVDFFTTGREPSEQDFARISEWIKKDKQKQEPRKPKATIAAKKLSK